ncbi:hypothetical protein GIB67_034395 [Kingdonia uniflora]|uniref:DUF4283 domain-containing protein n=1 Tax=Kingdonia uniflora TaxID=39325 RepID=A0A7J7NSD2_9MAGN|nr:hypothetical protein GIB67_034395 [Kingdonia uniflora]
MNDLASSLRKLMQRSPTNTTPIISLTTPAIRSEDNLALYRIQVSIGHPTEEFKEQSGQEHRVVCPWGFMKIPEGNGTNKNATTGEIAEYPSLPGLQQFKEDQVKFEAVQEYARTHWKLFRNCKLIPLGKCFFIIKLDNERDKTHIWGQGSWMVEKMPIHLMPWSPLFSANIHQNTNALIWSTINHDYGYYASVLVDIYLSKSIPNYVFIDLEGKLTNQEILLYRVPKFCNHCKNVGHSIAECKVILRAVHGEPKQVTKPVKNIGTTKSIRNSKVAHSEEGVLSKLEMEKNLQGPPNTHTYFQDNSATDSERPLIGQIDKATEQGEWPAPKERRGRSVSRKTNSSFQFGSIGSTNKYHALSDGEQDTNAQRVDSNKVNK